MRKRKHIYIQHPTIYCISCDKCNGRNIDWSEYEHKIWCYDCKVDTDGTEGIFDGPIPINTCRMLGINFWRMNLKTEKILKLVTSKDGKRLIYRQCSAKELDSITVEK